MYSTICPKFVLFLEVVVGMVDAVGGLRHLNRTGVEWRGPGGLLLLELGPRSLESESRTWAKDGACQRETLEETGIMCVSGELVSEIYSNRMK